MNSKTSETTQTTPKVAIIGGGPGGLTLARILQQKNIPVTVYEKETSSNERPQGGTLDLHPEFGQVALKEAGLWSEIQKVLRYEGEDFKLLDKTGLVHINDESDRNERPEVDRIQLRETLLNSLNPGTVQWGCGLLKVEVREDGKHDLHFENNKVVEGVDLVVGADGAFSKVRPLLTEVVPEYSTVSMVELKFSEVDTKHPEISKHTGRGTMSALAHNRAIIAQRNGDGSLKVYATLRVAEKYLKECGINFSEPKEAREGLLTHFEDWAPELKDYINLCDDSFIPRSLYMLPIGHKWASKAGVTLLGDAAHVMTPFAGVGVNLAMIDAVDLAEGIVNNLGDLKTGVENYEKKMLARAEENAKETWTNLELFLAHDSPLAFKEKMLSLMAGGEQA